MTKAYSFAKLIIYMNDWNLLTYFRKLFFKTAYLFMTKAYSITKLFFQYFLLIKELGLFIFQLNISTTSWISLIHLENTFSNEWMKLIQKSANNSLKLHVGSQKRLIHFKSSCLFMNEAFSSQIRLFHFSKRLINF